MKIDLWNNHTENEIAYADYFFYPNGGTYAGNLYDKNRKPIGDYTATDSTDIEKRFPHIFGN